MTLASWPALAQFVDQLSDIEEAEAASNLLPPMPDLSLARSLSLPPNYLTGGGNLSSLLPLARHHMRSQSFSGVSASAGSGGAVVGDGVVDEKEAQTNTEINARIASMLSKVRRARVLYGLDCPPPSPPLHPSLPWSRLCPSS